MAYVQYVQCVICGQNYPFDKGHVCFEVARVLENIMTLNGGDKLASGAHSATFGTGGNSKSELQWDFSMLTEKEFLAKYPEITKARYVEMIEEWYREPLA